MSQQTPFTLVDTADIHSIRRVEILQKHPEIKQLMGYDIWAALLTLSLVAVQLTLAAWWGAGINWAADWWKLLLFAYLVGAVINHWLGMAIHECSHDLMAPSTRQNNLLAIIATIPILFPVAMAFRRYHLLHHSHLGVEGIDNDFPSHREARAVGHSTLRKFIWLFFYVFFLTMARGFGQKPNRWEVFNIFVTTISTICIAYFLGSGAIFYLLLSTFFGYSLHPVAGHFIHEHFIFKHQQETYSYYGILNWVCFNVGYHNEHHDIMNIPGRLLPKYHQITKSYYQPLVHSKSWTAMFWDFIFSRRMAAYSRYSRSEQTRQKGLQQIRLLRK